MKLRIAEPARGGAIRAIPSKSAVHRLLIAAALAGLDISNEAWGISQDIDATKDCLAAIAAAMAGDKAGVAELMPRESGSTLRFLVPVVAALGIDADFVCKGRLADRPMGVMRELLESHGCSMSAEGSNPIEVRGKLEAGEYRLPGNVSSQYVTGLILALPMLEGDSAIQLEGVLQSRPYVDLTLEVVGEAGIDVVEIQSAEGTRFEIKGGQKYAMKKMPEIEGDWSNAAFWFVLDAITGDECRTEVDGLKAGSAQGDKAIMPIIRRVTEAGDKDIAIDVGNIPDLVPILSVLAAARPAGSITRIVNGERLRYKESDRLASVADLINSLGGSIEELPDGLKIVGTAGLKGGEIDSYNDHRIAMTAAIAAAICTEAVVINGAEAVSKSYPKFYEDYEKLGGKVELMEK
ncbi:MAG: 3-phosphoshikimate 1-carboxyvinyltransferase [Firmicutes bacterium]|nr:3-phosphoshikimate 1-carboxyvinyltransferase [Bacillota bacterium]